MILGVFLQMKKGAEKCNNKNSCREDNNIIDYSIYIMPLKEKIYHILKVMPIIYFLVYLFYKSHLFSLILSLAAFAWPSIENKKVIKKRRNELNLQFKDMLYSLHSSLSAGKSVELAFVGAVDDLAILYPSPDTYIIMEAIYIVRKLEMNETIESALDDFAYRSGIEDVQSFAEVLRICKRTGGNIADAIKRTTSIINDRIEIKQDIDTMLARKNFERKVLNIMPVIMLVLLSATAGDYINPVYTVPIGRIVMSIAALLITISYFISKKIMDIDV